MTLDARVLQGVGVSPGCVVGHAYVVPWGLPDVPHRSIVESQVDEEIARLREAVEAVRSHLETLRDRTLERAGPEEARIFEAQMLMLADPEFFGGVERLIRDNLLTAERAFEFQALEIRALWARSESAVLRQRRADLLGIGVRLLQRLLGKPIEQVLEAQDGGPIIVLTRELTPDLTVEFATDRVVGLGSVEGTRTSHAAILAHSLGIPCVMGLRGELDRVRTGGDLILDGNAGTILLDPSAEEIDDALAREQSRVALLDELERVEPGPSTTRDGEPIALRGNLDLPEELTVAVDHHAEGIGLMRTEFLVLGRTEMPTEDEQAGYFQRVGEALPGQPIVIRSYDLGGDKFPASFKSAREPNPFLGWRAIRVCLDEPEMFTSQLRAVLRARARADVQLMLPLVTQVEEVLQAKALVRQAQDALAREGVEFGADLPVGVMIETPAAMLMAEAIARHCDFLSVGTNDLTQYTLAVDRGNAAIATRFSSFHPAVVRSLKRIVDVGRQFGMPVSVCGEMASDPLAAFLLIGLGYRVLSVAPPRLPLVRWLVRQVDAGRAERAAAEAMQVDTTQAVVDILSVGVEGLYDVEVLLAGLLPDQSAHTSFQA